ncbi:hypothetical protein [Puniceicoccus vermicola]|uniref:DUF4380 domain-containing protein n=1 Tax=Puniceicoccus vermicola TaxID=388746 RepID=A0A7X1E547_9BACT|nr:hypothetical protein [Puniceicoccus vermicola]MBC2602781.1 hypothetical protein [Puniceicoccus vermicola]
MSLSVVCLFVRSRYRILWLLLAPWFTCYSAYQHLGTVETLDNGVVSLGVALDIGRIVSFKWHEAHDWIVAFDQETIPSWHWHPWGGARVWPTAQHLNLQIYGNDGFDPVIDGQPWELISKTATSLEMRSGFSPELGLRISHKIELVPEGAEVRHSYVVERLAESVYPVHVWAVTGVRAGDYILMESVDPSKTHKIGQAYKRWPGVYPEKPDVSHITDTNILKLSWSKSSEQKIGSYGHWIAMVHGRQAFCQSILYQPDALYLEHSNLQAYFNTERATYELETISPSWNLQKGERRQWTVHWKLVDFPEGVQTVDSIVGYLDAQMAPE